MKRLFAIGAIALPLVVLTAAPASADVKTRDRASVKFEGMLGHMFSLFGGKGAREGIETRTAVKGNRKATINDNTGKIIDLSEQKVYDLDMKKKTYTVTTFDQIRQKMKEDEEKAQQQAAKEQPSGQQAEQQQPPQKQMQVDFDVKETGQKKQISGYDAHEAIITITVHEKGKPIEDSGGLIMTDDVWLGPDVPQMKDLTDFDRKYWEAIEGPQMEMDAQQMATVMAMYPQVKDAMAKLQNGDVQGTPLDSTMTFDSVKSKEQMAQNQQSGGDQGAATGGIGGMFARRMMKKNNSQESQARSTIFTTHHEVLEITPTAADADVAIPPDFKEKQ